eukprot:scaffold1314_cov145-Skeletonema_menzelii.AAC.14
MWSSLSAYLYNDEDVKDVAASSSSSPAAAVPRPPTRNISPASSSALRTPSPRSSPLTVAMMSGGSNKGSAGKLNRASFDKSDSVAILRGVIVGMKGTGKTSLIRRLRGEDPFQKQQSKSGQQRSKLMALVPWNVPPNTEKINNLIIEQEERVQLYVSESVGFNESLEEQSFRKDWSTALQEQRGKEWNFAVWMIDPDMKNMLQYLQSGLDILFPATAAASEKRKQPVVQHLCILLNFRDTQEDDKSTFSQANKIVETVRKNTETRNLEAAQGDAKSAIIVVYESSMRVCFGLQQLHSFITLPYLAQKEKELLRRVKLAQKQQMQLTKTLMESKVADYNDFVTSDDQIDIEAKSDTPKETIERRSLEKEKERLKKQLKQQKRELDSRMHRRKSPVIMDNQIMSNEPPKENHPEDIGSAGHNRKLFQTPSKPETTKSVEPKKVVGEMSLESFFSEDESDDEVEAPRQMIDKRSKPNVTRLQASARVQVLDSDDSSSDSDDSDDDFYIDISGTRSSSDFAKITKIESTVTVEGIQSNIEGKGGDANDESTSNENNENVAENNEEDSGIIHGDTSATSEEQENAKAATGPNNDSEHGDGDFDVEDDEEGNDVCKPKEEDEPGDADAPSTPIDSDAVAECDKEKEGGAISSNCGVKEEVDDDNSSIDDGEMKRNGEVPGEGTNGENDTVTTEADESAEPNDDFAETDSSGTDSSVIKTEEKKVAAAVSSTPHGGSDRSVGDEPEEEKMAADVTSPTQRTLGKDAASKHENQTLKEEDKTALALPKQHTVDNDDGNESEDEFIVPASQEEPTRFDNDDGDESEDEFVVPASQEENSDVEPSKLSDDLDDAVHEADNASMESDHAQQEAVPSVTHVSDITKTTANGTSATPNNNIATVSSAALAAIEQARLEAEQMMVQSQPMKAKKEKKKKKEKSKKEKKAKKSKKKEESS